MIKQIRKYVRRKEQITVITRCGIMSTVLGLWIYQKGKEENWDNFAYIDYGNILSEELNARG